MPWEVDALDHCPRSRHKSFMFYRRDATRVSLAYRYHNPQWDLERNRLVYGEDHNVEGIGGNMTIWLEVAGSLHKNLLIPEKSLNATLSRLKSLLDHRCLFEVEPWFEARVPTLENIAVFLTEKIDRDWHSLTVEENENWRVQLFFDRRPPLLTRICFDGFTKTELSVEGTVDSESGLIASRAKMRTLSENSPEVRFFRIEKPGQGALERRLS